MDYAPPSRRFGAWRASDLSFLKPGFLPVLARASRTHTREDFSSSSVKKRG